jgi:hypothetical protein
VKVLFDQNTPRPLARFLIKHEVFPAADKGWERLKNGDLLNAAEADGFGAMVTAEKNLAYQQNLTGRHRALVILPFGRWPKVKPYFDEIVEAVDNAESGSNREIAPVKSRPPAPEKPSI